MKIEIKLFLKANSKRDFIEIIESLKCILKVKSSKALLLF